MKRILSILPVFLVLGLCAAPIGEAMAAENPRELSAALSRLKNNPRYQGRILGTHIRRDNAGFQYEVRILRRDDRVILVYIDPETGGVIGDSERSSIVRKKPNPLEAPTFQSFTGSGSKQDRNKRQKKRN